MRSTILSGAAAVLAAAQIANAQTFTSCNPTEKTCPSDPALGKTVTVDFTAGASDLFNEEAGTSLTYDPVMGAQFIMSQEGQAPTIASKDYVFFGTISVYLRAANGTGIVSSFILESDDLDEIDWEWLGGDTTQVESNYFGKGNTTTFDRAIYHPVTTPQDEFHKYTVVWSNQSIVWQIDDVTVRTLNYEDAVGGKNFPQTPCIIKMGNWDGGAAGEAPGTISWAGGLTPWNTAPFIMYVANVTIEDAQTGATSYTYGDESGSSQSIIINKDGATSVSSASSSVATDSISSSSGGSSETSSSGETISNSTTSSTNGSSSTSLPSSSSSSTSTSLLPGGTSVSPPSTNLTSSSNSTGSSSSGSSGSSSSTTSSSSSATTSPITSSDGIKVDSKYGRIDVAVLVLGLTMGYFFM